jgi:hypothetical protein
MGEAERMDEPGVAGLGGTCAPHTAAPNISPAAAQHDALPKRSGRRDVMGSGALPVQDGREELEPIARDPAADAW